MKQYYASMEEFRADAEAEGLDVDRSFKATYDSNNFLAGTYTEHLGQITYKPLEAKG